MAIRVPETLLITEDTAKESDLVIASQKPAITCRLVTPHTWHMCLAGMNLCMHPQNFLKPNFVLPVSVCMQSNSAGQESQASIVS